MRRLLRGHKGSIGSQREVNAREALKIIIMGIPERRRETDSRDKIGLELVQVDVEGTVKA